MDTPSSNATAHFPKIFRPSVFLRSAITAIGIVCCWIAGMLAVNAGAADHNSLYMAVVFAVAGLLISGSVLIVKFTVYADRIEHTTLFGKRMLMREEIQGYTPLARKPLIDLLPINDKQQKITVPLVYANNEVFVQWLQGIPKLD